MSKGSEDSDHFIHWKMDALTWLGRKMLPAGHWHGHGTLEQIAPDESLRKPRLYLTYDDGPDPHTTPQLLQLLEKENVRATFFMLGTNVEKHPELVKAVYDAGHAVGNHTYDHKFMPLLPTRSIEKQLNRTNAAIEQVTGESPIFFRPPYGILDSRVADCLKERSMQTVYWSSVSEDWLPLGAEKVVRRIRRKFNDGALIVLHERWFPTQTINATRDVILHAKQSGFDFPTLK